MFPATSFSSPSEQELSGNQTQTALMETSQRFPFAVEDGKHCRKEILITGLTLSGLGMWLDRQPPNLDPGSSRWSGKSDDSLQALVIAPTASSEVSASPAPIN